MPNLPVKKEAALKLYRAHISKMLCSPMIRVGDITQAAYRARWFSRSRTFIGISVNHVKAWMEVNSEDGMSPALTELAKRIDADVEAQIDKIWNEVWDANPPSLANRMFRQ